MKGCVNGGNMRMRTILRIRVTAGACEPDCLTASSSGSVQAGDRIPAVAFCRCDEVRNCLTAEIDHVLEACGRGRVSVIVREICIHSIPSSCLYSLVPVSVFSQYLLSLFPWFSAHLSSACIRDVPTSLAQVWTPKRVMETIKFRHVQTIV